MTQQPSVSGGGGQVDLGNYQGAFIQALKDLEKNRAAERVWAREPGFWKDDPGHQKEIRERLGWLTVMETMRSHVADLESFALDVKAAGIQHVVLCGMGGSSLCPEVLRLTFGNASGYPKLHVLDSTDPSTVAGIGEVAEPEHCLYLIASKSGGTIEVDSLYRYFYDKAKGKLGEHAGRQFAAITDPGTALERLGQERGFRKIFLNPSDIGGRYSALSLFGLVPAALLGIEVTRILDRAQEMAGYCSAATPSKANPGVWLGAAMGVMVEAGRDKLTILASPAIDSFGLWVEQLIGESTGKEGKGIVPVAGEPIGIPESYGNDRLFIYLRLEGENNETLDRLIDQLRAADHPVVTLSLRDRYDLWAEFFRWEFATAVAGAMMKVDPFDQPNVQESKDNTSRVLAQYQQTGSLPTQTPDLVEGDLKLYGAEGSSLKESISSFVEMAAPGDYFALLAYLPATSQVDALLSSIRDKLRARTGLATTLGYGPRFLHSTGQLHKGGPNSGVFLQLTADEEVAVPVPGKPYDFGTLKMAQATGDWQALRQHGRRALWVHLGMDIAAGLQKILAAL
ncbi:MAG: glucose-6-phosphate isomerase [Chloroflexota bacterium]|jgi:glucose-6-phosphate isomerase